MFNFYISCLHNFLFIDLEDEEEKKYVEKEHKSISYPIGMLMER